MYFLHLMIHGRCGNFNQSLVKGERSMIANSDERIRRIDKVIKDFTKQVEFKLKNQFITKEEYQRLNRTLGEIYKRRNNEYLLRIKLRKEAVA